MTALGQREILPIKDVNRLLVTFLVFLVIFSAIIEAAIISFGSRYVWIAAMMWMPALAAFCAIKYCKADLSIIGWGWGDRKWQWIAWATPVIYMAIAVGIWVGSDLGWFKSDDFASHYGKQFALPHWSTESVMAIVLPWILTIGVLRSLFNTLGEEIGWRGLLVPLLARKYSFNMTALISGAVWALWHWPIIIWGGYYEREAMVDDIFLPLVAYSVMTIALSWPLAYLRLKSGSMWSAAIFHASHNAILLGVVAWFFKPSHGSIIRTESLGDLSPVGEFGYVLPTLCVITAIYFAIRAHREGLDGGMNAEESDERPEAG